MQVEAKFPMNLIISSKSKNRLFYGWYIVAGLATISMVSVGMGGMNLGLFVIPMQDELGITHFYTCIRCHHPCENKF